ncbi:cysteine desulfurase [Curtobacterium sp. MCJR17_055]|uniref:aminotransferase class V-fold PLP-dependent enzyme n=1 Tax=unclassified Curtobacterium TaxID=257496 RepID=UPI000D8F39A8|nr:cysteine desulfurase [Curtobacterium sp. MCBD17_029]PYY54700.1 cysteine desulfurase [Curtobacterium sp. MCJR17_055]PYY60935.1 cysteine desulfurase [Curtobacterium sp. MCPF17_015]PZE96006.1 cysteine desulfurase [Curtobacterium sp. MCBD17_008]
MTIVAPTPTDDFVAPLTEDEVLRIRADFPILQQEVNGQPLAYLDSGATAERPVQVLDAERCFLEQDNAAVHRGAHTLAALSTDAYEDARATVARFIGAASPSEVVWTANATDALNLVAYGIRNASAGRGGAEADRFRIGPGDEVLVTEAEHHANLVPWQELAAATGATLRWVPVDDTGCWSAEDAVALVTEHTRVVAFAHVSNVTGMIAPVAELVAAAHAVGALVVLDACQSAPHRPLDVRALDIDFAAFSGHKMLGPNGIGVLWGRQDLLNALPPFRTGGSMITTVTMEHTDFMPAPERFEAGTQPVSQAVALAEAVRYLERIGMDRVQEHEEHLAQRMLTGLATVPGVSVVGPAAGVPRSGLASFVVDGVHAHDVSQYLDAQGIAVRSGHHCAQPLHRRLGLTATSRASTYVYTTEEDVDRFVTAVGGIRGYFGAEEPA